MTTALDASPSLLPLYARAAVGALPVPGLRGTGSGALPGSVYTLGAQRVDPDRLAAYQRVCGFRVTDVLPPTYLHVLAFPVSVALMTERGFSFGLMGLVHVANSITVSRPVRAGEMVSFTVHAADLRPHPAGRQFDVLAETTVDGEAVWRGRSTYLRRGGTDRPERPKQATATATASDRPVSLVRVPDDIGRRYAAVSGDRNPIHLHALTARLFGFRSAIAHGMWVAARTLAALEGRLPEACTVDVAFKTPVFLPSTVAIGAQRTAERWSLDVRNARSGKPHLAGTVAGPAPQRSGGRADEVVVEDVG